MNVACLNTILISEITMSVNVFVATDVVVVITAAVGATDVFVGIFTVSYSVLLWFDDEIVERRIVGNIDVSIAFMTVDILLEHEFILLIDNDF